MTPEQSLIKEWIQFLKNNQIVGMQSDPKTGKLNYRQKVTEDLVRRFLKLETDLDDDAIDNILATSLGDKGNEPQEPEQLQQPKGSNLASVDNTQGGAPATQQQKQQQTSQQPKKQKYNNNDAEDVAFRPSKNKQPPKQLTGNRPALPAPVKPQEPGTQQKSPTPGQPARKPHFRLRKVKEDIVDNPGATLSEQDIEKILKSAIKYKLKSKNKASQQGRAGKSSAAGTDQETNQPQNKDELMNRIRRIIRKQMSPGSRKSLWRALNEDT